MYNRTFWKNRSVEHPHRYTDETGQEKTFTQAPGEVYEAGTPMEQGKLNNQETGIAAVYAAMLFLVQQVGLLMTKVQAIFTQVQTNSTAIAGKAAAKDYTATFAAGTWSGTGPYTQTVAVAGMLATDTPLVDVVLSDTPATAETQLEEYAYLGRVDTAENAITATCYTDVPTLAMTLALKVVK